MNNTPHILVGKTVTGLWISEGGGALKFDIEGGEPIIALADGDCCSHSWVEHVQGVEQLLGSPVVSVEDVDGVEPARDDPEHEWLQFYGCKITTHKGYALIDYRNSSNGYYGGSLVWPGEDFYGGVKGQNGSTSKWTPITE